jgi:hypothetical protein
MFTGAIEPIPLVEVRFVVHITTRMIPNQQSINKTGIPTKSRACKKTPLKVSNIIYDSIAKWIRKMRKVNSNAYLPRQHVLAFCPGDFDTPTSLAFAMDKVCDFLQAGSNPSILKLAMRAFGGNLRQLSNSRFGTNWRLTDVQGMGPGAKGAISTKPIARDDVVALYFGGMVTEACSNTMYKDNDHRVRIDVTMSDGSNQVLVLVGDRDITGPTAFINDCRSEVQKSGVAKPADLDRVNVRLVHANICGIPVVFVTATNDIEPDTILLLDYGVRFWCAKK